MRLRTGFRCPFFRRRYNNSIPPPDRRTLGISVPHLTSTSNVKLNARVALPLSTKFPYDTERQILVRDEPAPSDKSSLPAGFACLACSEPVCSGPNGGNRQMYFRQERRAVERTWLNRGALLTIAGLRGVYSCGVRDLSRDGAGLRLNGLVLLPIGFGLSLDGLRSVAAVELICERRRLRRGSPSSRHQGDLRTPSLLMRASRPSWVRSTRTGAHWQ